MPVDWNRYPKDWKTEVVPRIRARSGDRCEWCDLPNKVRGYRDKEGKFFPLEEALQLEGGELAGMRAVQIILTTAHLGVPHPDGRAGDKHDKHDNRDENLAHLCQRCHLLYDLDDHVRNAMATRRRQKQELGFQELDLGL